jgi:hypothetical protein
MKFKALRKKSTGEFVFFLYNEYSDSYDLYTVSVPEARPSTCTIEGLRAYYQGVDFSDIELIEYEFKEVEK